MIHSLTHCRTEFCFLPLELLLNVNDESSHRGQRTTPRQIGVDIGRAINDCKLSHNLYGPLEAVRRYGPIARIRNRRSPSCQGGEKEKCNDMASVARKSFRGSPLNEHNACVTHRFEITLACCAHDAQWQTSRLTGTNLHRNLRCELTGSYVNLAIAGRLKAYEMIYNPADAY